MDGTSIGRWLCERALEQGFDFAGIAPLGPARTSLAWLEALEEGRQGPLMWMARRIEVRMDPSRYCPSAQAAVVVGVALGHSAPLPENPWLGVARYAQLPDYHAWFKAALEQYVQVIQATHPGAHHWTCVDAAPVPERELAVRAGLGAVGKHTLLIHPTWGSQVLLGVVLTSLPAVGEMHPIADLCGRCRRCLDACPTGALSAYKLDARRCLTTWTVEWRGVIPASLREAAANWWFGCDACQNACPWNRDQGRPPGQLVPHPIEPLDPVEILALEESALADRLRESALLRPGVTGLRRNAAVALARRCDERSLQVLSDRLAHDPSPVVRATCAWSLARRREPSGSNLLRAALELESNPTVRAAFLEALEELEGPPASRLEARL